ncbi:MAG: DNA cytosine methyltransferase [Treponema sp.]|nr:DNA cytosine methyltransferase [Treponema sp.]
MSANVIDLFSGAGGLTYGFSHRIENNTFVKDDFFNFLFANEYDHNAAMAFSANFPQISLIEGDIADINQDFLRNRNIDTSLPVDLIIGGPPCQSYSTVGKRQYDQRAKMYREYMRMLKMFRPSVFIFENVTGMLSMKNDTGTPVINDIEQAFKIIDGDFGYKLFVETLNAKNFGVPQSRERVFIVGVRKDIDYQWTFPIPTHGRKRNQQNYVKICEAISDLPCIKCGQKKINYKTQPQTDYEKLMRGDSQILEDHECGIYGEKMSAVIKAVKQGEGRPYINELVEKGELPKECYLTSGYKNTYGRLWWDKPSTTITNSLGTPSALRCIHPFQNRALTTREGARLQSMPDTMHFFGNKHERNSQVGNAVPPLLAMALAEKMRTIPFEQFRK